MPRNVCFRGDDFGYPIVLEQNGPDDFIVTYGGQVDRALDYNRAASKLGQAIMHALACENVLDNRSKAEAARDRRR